jgi:hypothetical protein
MSALRASRVASRARAAFRAPIQRRGYADAAPDKIKLSLSLPHTVRLLALDRDPRGESVLTSA